MYPIHVCCVSINVVFIHHLHMSLLTFMCLCCIDTFTHAQGSMDLKDAIIPRIPRQHYCSYGLIPLPSPFTFLSQDSPLPSPPGANSYMFPSDAGSHRPEVCSDGRQHPVCFRGCVSVCSELTLTACLVNLPSVLDYWCLRVCCMTLFDCFA